MCDRFECFEQVIAVFDRGYDLALEYDSIPHRYGDEVLYQSEMHLIQAVGREPNITITAISKQSYKTKSACSQMVHKLRRKGLLYQSRNKENNREYNLNLTERGWEIYKLHEAFDKRCLIRSCTYLDSFTTQELEIYIAVQSKLNQAFERDVEENGELCSES